MMNDSYLLECKSISKTYPGVIALDKVSFAIRKGSIHALVGENGAGKSTLARIIYGLTSPSSGEIHFEGKKVIISSPAEAMRIGINMMTQEIDYCPNLSVAGNIFLGDERMKGFRLDWEFMNNEAQTILDELGVTFKSTDKAELLTTSQKQQMELARILYKKGKLILMDEPTSTLNEEEVRTLFRILRTIIQSKNLSILYISHRMEEVFDLADTITVLRDGRHIATKEICETSIDEIISMIVGRKQKFERFIGEGEDGKPIILEIKNFSKRGVFSDVSFSLRSGEILGLFGLRGSGIEQLGRSIAGIVDREDGVVVLKGKHVTIDNPSGAIKNGVIYISSNRREEGIFQTMLVRDNIIGGSLEDITKFGVIDYKRAAELSERMVEKLQIDCSSILQKIVNLSGGNQQKVIVARSVLMNANVLIVDNPTRGIDVGAKREIYRILRELANEGIAVIVISSEISDILAICDSVLIMKKGSIVGELNWRNVDEEKLLELAMA